MIFAAVSIGEWDSLKVIRIMRLQILVKIISHYLIFIIHRGLSPILTKNSVHWGSVQMESILLLLMKVVWPGLLLSLVVTLELNLRFQKR